MSQVLSIKTIQHLEYNLGIPQGTLKRAENEFLKTSKKRTRTTKKGKTRTFITATKNIKILQKKILSLLEKIPLHISAIGWRKGYSIKDNAKAHCNNSFIICLDLKDCFPNIHSSQVRKLFEETLLCSPQVSAVLTRLTTYNYQLAQGFSTSGYILNLIMKNIDEQIYQLATVNNMTYTRYGDDITISGKKPHDGILNKVKDILKKNNYIVNTKKENVSKGAITPLITGLNCAGPKPKVPRSFKRKLRAKMYLSLYVKNQRERISLQNSIRGSKNYIKLIEQ